MRIEPVGDLLLVKRMDKEVVTEGGIYLPMPNQKSYGVVQSMGRGVFNKITNKFSTFNIEPGDIVFFQTHRGHSVMVDTTEDSEGLTFLSMNHVLCMYKKEDLIDGQMNIKIKIEDSAPTSFLV